MKREGACGSAHGEGSALRVAVCDAPLKWAWARVRTCAHSWGGCKLLYIEANNQEPEAKQLRGQRHDLPHPPGRIPPSWWRSLHEGLGGGLAWVEQVAGAPGSLSAPICCTVTKKSNSSFRTQMISLDCCTHQRRLLDISCF